jgi:transcriptional regulator GlxA family with amidase domain
MDWRICRTLTMMHTHTPRPLHVATLAKEMNLSTSHFSHLFQRETGRSPARYLHDLRLDRAFALLTDSTMSIKEVMAAVGLNDPSHFTRDFSERHGLSPRACRSNAHEHDESAMVDARLSSRNGQQTARFANATFRDRGSHIALSEVLRDGRAEGA